MQTLEAEKKKRGEGEGGRSAMIISIGSDTIEETSCADRVSEQRPPAAAVVDYGERSRAGGGRGVTRTATVCTRASPTTM